MVFSTLGIKLRRNSLVGGKRKLCRAQCTESSSVARHGENTRKILEEGKQATDFAV